MREDESKLQEWSCIDGKYLWSYFLIEYNAEHSVSHIIEYSFERNGRCKVDASQCTTDGYRVTEFIAPDVQRDELKIKADRPSHAVDRISPPDDEICWLNWINDVKQPVESCGGRVFGSFTDLGNSLEEVGRPTCATFGR